MTTHSHEKLNTHYTEKLSRNATALSTLFLLPAVSQAAVIHNTSSLTISIEDARAFDYQPVDWDVDGNSVADFRLEAFRDISYFSSGGSTYGGYSSSRPFGRLELNSAGLNQRMIEGPGIAADTVVGPTLDAGLQWDAGGNRVMMSSSSYFGYSTTNIFDTGFVGFSFQNDINETLYGWAQITIDENFLDMTINQWAYESDGSSIQVGQVSSVPLPPSALLMLSGLALGAGGLVRGRKLRNVTQKKTL